jgi:hypothetical protein
MGRTIRRSSKLSDTIIFRGCFIRHADIRQGKDGGDVFTRIHLSAEFSEPVREKMEWEDPGDSITSARLTGELLAQNFILTPGDKMLQQHELQIAISDASDFQVVMLKDDEGEPAGRQLRFIVRSPGDGVEALVGKYIRRVGRHEGQLKISYEPQAHQESLPMSESMQVELGDGTMATVSAPQERTGAIPSAREMQAAVRETSRRSKPGVQ